MTTREKIENAIREEFPNLDFESELIKDFIDGETEEAAYSGNPDKYIEDIDFSYHLSVLYEDEICERLTKHITKGKVMSAIMDGFWETMGDKQYQDSEGNPTDWDGKIKEYETILLKKLTE